MPRQAGFSSAVLAMAAATAGGGAILWLLNAANWTQDGWVAAIAALVPLATCGAFLSGIGRRMDEGSRSRQGAVPTATCPDRPTP